MYTNLLIATDGSDLAEMGVLHGLTLASRLKAGVTVLTVTEPFPVFDWENPMVGYAAGDQFREYQEQGRLVAQRLLGRSKGTAKKLGVKAKLVHVENRMPAEAILELSKTERCDLIVMASHGRRGLGRLLLGSQATEVLSYSDIPVLIVRQVSF